jgi:hypothetical protein
MTEPKIIASEFIGEHKRFRLDTLATRFDTVECFAFDAQDISDEQVRAGELIEPFAQGSREACMAAIGARR